MKSARQKKLTDSFKKAKLPKPSSLYAKEKCVKRKLLIEDDVNENSGYESSSSTAADVIYSPQPAVFNEFQEAKKALHTSNPTILPSRDSQICQVFEFLTEHLGQNKAGSMYISGAPGTGKTAVVQHVIHKISNPEDFDDIPMKEYKFQNVFINCMSLKSPLQVYEGICNKLKIKAKGDSMKEELHKRFMSKSAIMKVVVLDEMDQLLTGRQNEILYSLFDWARTPDSKLILIGVANALDLTVRHLPLLTASSSQNSPKMQQRGTSLKHKCKSIPDQTRLMHFPPYERADIEFILESRLKEIGSEIFDPAAIKFVAAKVAASNGDMRKALNACKTAIEAIERQERIVFKVSADDGFNSSSPKKIRGDRVGVTTVSKVLGIRKDEGPLPLQQMIILATLVRIHNKAPNARQVFDGVLTPIPVATLYDEYRKMCTEKAFSWIDRCEILSVCSMLQDRSLVTVIENGPGIGKLKKNSKSQSGVLFDPKAAETLLQKGDLKSFTDI